MNQQTVIDRAKEMQESTDSHLLWCVGEVIRSLNDDELGELVAERNDETWDGPFAKLNQPAKRPNQQSPRARLINSMESYYFNRATA